MQEVKHQIEGVTADLLNTDGTLSDLDSRTTSLVDLLTEYWVKADPAKVLQAALQKAQDDTTNLQDLRTALARLRH